MSSGQHGWLTQLDAGATAADVEAVITKGGGVLLRSFPVEPHAFLGLIRQMGEPCQEYASLIVDERSTAERGFNVVKLNSTGGRVHHRPGALRPHCARSWANRRPRYFALLMIEPGWRDRPHGLNGESLFVPWRAAFASLAATQPRTFEADFELLASKPIAFSADHVREEVNEGPIVYPLEETDDRFDSGVRVKQDLPDLLMRLGEGAAAKAVGRLQARARLLCADRLLALDGGDLVIVDNNRWAHGRCEFEVERRGRLNPREIWSTTIQ